MTNSTGKPMRVPKLQIEPLASSNYKSIAYLEVQYVES